MKTVKIESTSYGSLQVDAEKLIEFPAGLPGFEDCKRFTLIEVDSLKAPAIGILQSADQPDVAFSVSAPENLGLHYEFNFTPQEKDLLRATKAEDIAVLLILRHEESPNRRRADSTIKASLMGPLVINSVTRRGLQKVVGQMALDITLRPLDDALQQTVAAAA